MTKRRTSGKKPTTTAPAKTVAKAQTPAKRRTPVPQTVADEVMTECDRICCVCRRREAVQIHHLNENPDDHRFTNLAGLCFECHEKTQVSGGFGRKLQEGEVRKARNAWYRLVRRRKRTGLPRPDLSDSVDFRTVLEAVAVVRIREIGLGAVRGGDLDALYAFSRGFGPRVAMEALDVLSRAALYAQESADRAVRICDIVREFLPLHSLVGRRYRPLVPEEREILHEAAVIGHEVAYVAARRLGDLIVLNAGGRLLWAILRFAVINEELSLRESAAADFEDLKRWCEGARFSDGLRWLTFLVEDATQPKEFKGMFPVDIANKLAGITARTSKIRQPAAV